MKITAIGSYVPDRLLSNYDLEKMVDTSNEWIIQRTGIKYRHLADQESNVEMATKACLDLSARYHKNLTNVDFIIYATSTGEHRIPSLSSQLQNNLKIKNAGTIDIASACAGFVYGLIVGQSLVKSGVFRKILLVSSEVLSNFVDFTDRNTCILFGDGASAVLIEPSENSREYIPVVGTEGENGHILYISDLSKSINSKPVNNNNKIFQDGRKVFKWAVNTMSQKFNEILTINKIGLDEIDFFVPHSANLRIIEAICTNVGFDIAKSLYSIHIYGNTSAASIPLSIDHGVKENRLTKGDKLLILGFGGGLTYAGAILEWQL